MAQVGVSGASVGIDYGDGIKPTVTNSAGQYTYIVYMTEEEYNALPANVSIEAKKTGYTGVVVSSEKPDYATAVAGGVQIDAEITKIEPDVFSITPTTIVIPAGGGTATITVNAPDNTWDFQISMRIPGVTAARTDDTTITITSNADTEAGHSTIGYVTWGEAELRFNVYTSA